MAYNVMIVDDAAFMRLMLRDILMGNGYVVDDEAENGVQAVTLYKRRKPDLVLMDITMPEMNGIRAVREIIKADPDAKIVMCSAMGQQAMVIDSIQSGALDFVVKPFNPERVLEAVRKVLTRKS